MRLVFSIDPYQMPLCALLCATTVLATLPQTVSAQVSVPVTDVTNSVFVTVADTSGTLKLRDVANTANNRADASVGELANATPGAAADANPSNDVSLDHQALSHQRGGFSGMLKVAATPQLMRGAGDGGNGVTLWDEIAPPSPMPIPLDAAANAQGKVAAYQVKSERPPARSPIT